MRIAVIANRRVQEAVLELPRVIDTLTQLGAAVTCAPENLDFPHNVTEQLLCGQDVIVALGGDGTIMHVAKRAAQYDIPVLGINCGRLGFLAGLEASELSLLHKLIDGTYTPEKRMLLEIEAAGKCYRALNEVVLSRGASPRIIDIRVLSNGEQVLRYQADGVIAATPTGSTAYALSAGGPVVDPSLRCTLVTPICAHTLYSRSYLFGENAGLTLCACAPDDTPVQLTVDSEETVSLSGGTTVSVRPASVQATLIQCKPQAFYTVLEHKLTLPRGMEESV